GAEERLRPGVDARAVKPDHLGDRLDVSPRRIKNVAVLLARRAAVAGTDGIDEHEVAVREPGRLAIDDPRRRVLEPLRVGLRRIEALRPEADEVHLRGAGTGAAVPQERDGPRGLAAPGLGDVG